MRTLTEQAQAFTQFQEYLVKGGLDLFAGYGLPVEHSMGASAVAIQGPSVMAVIGYAAQTFRGALLLLTSRAVVAELEPKEIRSGPPTEAVLRGILGEFCNMLVGRIKNRLVAHELLPLVSTPTTIFGDDLQLPAPMSGMSAWHRFASPAGDVFVRLDATFESEFALPQAEPDKDVALPEGEMVIFGD
jgi:hypothetical protein